MSGLLYVSPLAFGYAILIPPEDGTESLAFWLLVKNPIPPSRCGQTF